MLPCNVCVGQRPVGGMWSNYGMIGKQNARQPIIMDTPTIKVAVHKLAAVVVHVHGQDGDAGQQRLQLFAKCGFSAARGASKADLQCMFGELQMDCVCSWATHQDNALVFVGKELDGAHQDIQALWLECMEECNE